MTPLHLNIALHYHCRTVQWPDLHIPVHARYAMDLRDAGLLKSVEQPDGEFCHEYEKTDGLAVWVEALCSTPFPELRWVMPFPATRAETNQREDARG